MCVRISAGRQADDSFVVWDGMGCIVRSFVRWELKMTRPAGGRDSKSVGRSGGRQATRWGCGGSRVYLPTLNDRHAPDRVPPSLAAGWRWRLIPYHRPQRDPYAGWLRCCWITRAYRPLGGLGNFRDGRGHMWPRFCLHHPLDGCREMTGRRMDEGARLR